MRQIRIVFLLFILVFAIGATFTSATTFQNINGIRFASQFSGSDLGAQINSAVADCVSAAQSPCLIIVDKPGTISTPPNLPQGYHILFTPGSYTLATTWAIMHSGTVYDFGGAQFSYNQDTGNAAFLVSKNSTGTVNTSGTTVTFVSGTNFANIDVGDGIAIGTAFYNVCGVSGAPTSITLCASAGTQTGVAYAAYLNPATGIGSFPNSIRISDLSINYTGAGTNANDTGIQLTYVTNPILSNVFTVGFSNGFGLRLNGAIDAEVYGWRSVTAKNPLTLDVYNSTSVQTAVTSNNNKFIRPTILACPAGGTGILIQGGSGGNDFDMSDVEGCQATQVVVIQGAGTGMQRFRGGDFERNGDGTPSSTDVAVTSGSLIWDGVGSSSSATNFPASGVLCSGSSVNCIIQNSKWSGQYSTAYHIFGCCTTGLTSGNIVLAGAFGDPAIALPTSGNAKLNALQVTDEGTCNMSSGTCPGQLLSHTYNNAPKCFANWTGTGTLTGLIKVPSTTTSVTPASSVGTDTAQVNWACFGN